MNNSPSTSPVSAFAHLYLGEAGVDPTPVFRDLSPDALPDGTAWREGSVFAVWFDGSRWPTKRVWFPDTVDRWAFFDQTGKPLGFPEQLEQAQLQYELQVFPYDWWTWEERTLQRVLRNEAKEPGRMTRLRAQAGLGGSLLVKLTPLVDLQVWRFLFCIS